MLTIALHWWYLPIALVIGALISFYIGSKQPSSGWWDLNGLWHAVIGIGLLVAALVSLITGLIA
jgi:cytochrome b561